jgi:hypothetical protein
MPIDEVARRVGCSARTIRRERARSPEFRREIRDARHYLQVGPLDELRRLARSHWRAAAWLLERTRPQEFGPCRPATFRPPEIDAACMQIIEAALAEIHEPELRSRLYSQMRGAADRACDHLAAAGVVRASTRAASESPGPPGQNRTEWDNSNRPRASAAFAQPQMNEGVTANERGAA